MRLFFSMLLACLLFFNMSSSVAGHGSGPPYVKVNGEYANTNPILNYTTPKQFEVGADVASPSAYIVKGAMLFEIDMEFFPNPYAFREDPTTMMQVPIEGAPQPVFRWNFGDNSQVEGQSVEHTYSKAGTYLVDLEVKFPGKIDTFQSVNTIQINILPHAGYKIPQPRITFDGKVITNPDRDYVEIEPFKNYSFDGSKSTGSIKKYQWDFDDGSGTEGKLVSHKYRDPDLITAYPVLRVTDEYGIFSDIYATLDFPIESDSPLERLVTGVKHFFLRLWPF
jgi:hypothetical protein